MDLSAWLKPPSALARNDPTLLATSDQHRPREGATFAAGQERIIPFLQTPVQGGSESVVDRTFHHSMDIHGRSMRQRHRWRRVLAQMMETQTARRGVDDIAVTVLAHGNSCSSRG